MSSVIFFDRYTSTPGDDDAVRVADEDVPAPGAGEVLVANRAVGVNPADAKLVAGKLGHGRGLPAVPGYEAAGVVEAVGPEVDDVAVGSEVVWHGTGTWRERAVVPVKNVVLKPDGVPFDQAAVLPIAAATAFSALVQAGMGSSDTVLIHGAAGGVGSAAVQIATALGARVIGSASPRNHEYLRGLGAEPVAYGEGLVEAVRALGGVTAVVDLAGTSETVEATVVLLGDAANADDAATDDAPTDPSHSADSRVPGALRAVTIVRSDASRAAGIADKIEHKGALAEVLALAVDGRLTIEISARLPLAQAAEALQRIGEGHVRGKIVLEV